jgi:adenine deaminase
MVRISGKIVDVISGRIYAGEIQVEGTKIVRIIELHDAPDFYIIPGLIDAHIHIESSMVTPCAFAVEAVSRGTTGVVSDPHEIANVLGVKGVEYMIEEAGKVPLKFWFGAPSCVPATTFESSGAVLDSEKVRMLLEKKEILYLSEMMNFPGVINGDKEVLKKLSLAQKYNKPVDGHSPGLTGEDLKKYVNAGISTDHECSTLDEAMEKIALGMKILIREGSAARNLEALKSLIKTNPEKVMLCSDDLHPEMLMKRHINGLVSALLREGFDLFDVLRSCTRNPSDHYKLNSGLLQEGDSADFIVTDDLYNMNILETWINGKKVYDKGKVLFSVSGINHLNNFNAKEIRIDDIMVLEYSKKARVIQAIDGELLTRELIVDLTKKKHRLPDTSADILKIVLKERYKDKPPVIGFINGFGLKSGAIASSVAHDSHNIISIGADDEDIVNAVNQVIKMKGGLCVSVKGKHFSLPLPVAGIMTDSSVAETAKIYKELSEKVKSVGCNLSAPFMTLSFMALLVIPELKISDSGLFDGRSFNHVQLFLD